jgi:hypothetical protein
MTLIADIVTAVTTTPAPVLFLDTCILLDVVRAPIRNKASEVEFARLFLGCARKAPKTAHLLVASPIRSEWNTNIASGVNDCATGVHACNAVSSICGHLGLPPVPVLPAAVLNMPALLQQLSTDLLAACDTVDDNAAALGRAVGRIINDRHPVKRPHSQGAKDSIILEHAVETTSALRGAGFAGVCLFVSSNTKDFADPGSTNLHAQLVPAFSPVNLRYAVSLTDAESILTVAGWVP